MHVDRSPGVQCKRNKITGIDLEKDREKWIRGVRGGNEPRINKPSVSREPNESSLTIEGDGGEKSAVSGNCEMLPHGNLLGEKVIAVEKPR